MRQLHDLGKCWCGSAHVAGEPYEGIPVVRTLDEPAEQVELGLPGTACTRTGHHRPTGVIHVFLLWCAVGITALVAALAMIQVSHVVTLCNTQLDVLLQMNQTQIKMQAEIAGLQLRIDKLGTLPVQRRAGTN